MRYKILISHALFWVSKKKDGTIASLTMNRVRGKKGFKNNVTMFRWAIVVTTISGESFFKQKNKAGRAFKTLLPPRLVKGMSGAIKERSSPLEEMVRNCGSNFSRSNPFMRVMSTLSAPPELSEGRMKRMQIFLFMTFPPIQGDYEISVKKFICNKQLKDPNLGA